MTTAEASRAPAPELPPAPPGRTGWPWTEIPPPLPARRADGGLWPRITVVTPSYNQGPFLEETVRSVLLQGYPELEYIVMDGGSTDESVAILRRYAPWLAHWESERDRGQTHAINKGLERATGEIFAYINSDDLLAPGALEAVANAFAADPGAAVVYGDCEYVDEERRHLRFQRPRVTGYGDYLRIWRRMHSADFLTQPEVFCRTGELRAGGGFREELHQVMDFEMWLRLLARGSRFRRVDRPLAEFRLLANQKSSRNTGDELNEVIRAYVDGAGPPLPAGEREEFERELREARGHWLLRAAIASNQDGAYADAVALCLRAARTYPPLLGSYEMWASLAAPAKGLVPRAWRQRLQARVRRRRGIGDGG